MASPSISPLSPRVSSYKHLMEDMSISDLRALIVDAQNALRLKRVKSNRLQLDLERAARASGLDPKEIELLFG